MACMGRGGSDAAEKMRELYGRTPEEFTAARNALAKELKAAGHADQANEVGKLRKPTVAVWAVNQAARAHPDLVAAVLDAGSGLAKAQAAALAGRGGELAAASKAMRMALTKLATEAEKLIGAPAASVKQRVWQLLQAAATGTEKERSRLEE